MKGNNPDFPLHSVNAIKKRINLMAFSTIGTGFFISVIYSILGLSRLGMMIFIFCCVIAFLLFLNNKYAVKNTKLVLITFVSLSLIVFAADEGISTGQYLFYFPSMIAIPIIVDNQKTYINKVIFYFLICGTSFIACILVGTFHKPWEQLSDLNQSRIFFANSFAAIVATIVFAYINVSSERKYLQQLIDQKNTTIDTRTNFLSTMGHELRTPLNGIIGAINLLVKADSLPDQKEYFNILKYCSDQMLYQINDILDFNKIEAGKLEIHPVEVNLKQLLVNSVMPFINSFEEKGLKLLLEIDPQLNQILLIDDVRIIQILNNLLSNAGKFTNKGYIKLAAKTISKNSENIKVKIFVEDTGSGIAKENQQKVFDSFGQEFDVNTRKITGSGLGLTICTQILELMDSKMELESEKGVGSKFSFNIDFKIASKQQLSATENLNISLNGMKILLVEDNQINMLIANKMLDSLNADISTAFNGIEAIACLEKNANQYHIVLMDLEMPVMDGFTAIKQIKTRWPQMPVLAFTASMINPETRAELQAIGFKDYISKPFQAPVLLNQIKKYALVPDLNLN